MTRRQFAFWVGFGLFNLAEKLRADSLDSIAAAAMRTASSSRKPSREGAVHWSACGDKEWRWFERENYIDEEWVSTGITAPIHRETGERKLDADVYLDERLVPPSVRGSESVADVPVSSDHPDLRLPTATRRGRHGRPPSKWLRSLDADELRIWLDTVDVPEAGVEGMTYFEHLTRDHSFAADRIKGLTVEEQAKLHAAAHFGY